MARGTSGGDRARRLVALVGQLTPGARLRIADLAAEVGATEAELTADLETLTMCGVAPYDPGDLTPIYVEDGYVEVWGELPALKGPVRLSASEASALATALQSAGFTADDELTGRLLHAAGTTAFDAEELERTVRAAIATHEAEVYETLADSVRQHAVLAIEYVKSGADETIARAIEPMALFAERGAWYVTAWCRRTADWRTFRIDRIRAAALTGDTFDASARSSVPDTGHALSTEGLPTARLRFAADEPFTEREWPGVVVVEQAEDCTVIADVPYAGTAWVARQVVARLGAIEVLEPTEVRDAVRGLAEDQR